MNKVITAAQVHTHLSLVQIISLVVAILSGIATGLQSFPSSIAWAGPVATIVFGVVAAVTGWVKAYNVPIAGMLICMCILFLGGCANQNAAFLSEANAADATVVAFDRLAIATPPVVSLSLAKKVAVDASVVDSGLQAAMADMSAGKPSSQATLDQITASLATLAGDLQSVPTPASSEAVVTRLQAKLRISPGDVAAIIELAIQLEPVVAQELNTLLAGQPVTIADDQSALFQFESNLTKLNADVSALGLHSRK